MYFNGGYSYVVLNITNQGDFRVQDDFCGTVHDYQPAENEISISRAALNACFSLPVYARVDVIIDNEGYPAIIEQESIKPELWLRNSSYAAIRFATTISKFL